MARHQDGNWNLPNEVQWTHVQVAVLMDIRDELRKINRKLDCHRVGRMLDDVHRMDKRLAKKFGPLSERKK